MRRSMELWRRLSIQHRDHLLCNPLSSAKLDRIVDLLRIPAGGRFLDVACGKGELLVRAARAWSADGVGVDLSPYAIADARERAQQADLAGRIELHEIDGAQYRAPAESFDACLCIGASWIWGGYAPTLAALEHWTRPGGVVAVGEPFWLREPSREHLAGAGLERASFATHLENAQGGIERGLALLHTVVSTPDDWDVYEGLQWAAVERYALEHAGDADLHELLQTQHRHRDLYLRYGRDELGWAVYLFQK
jgi:SAM-dependent methyltransferase